MKKMRAISFQFLRLSLFLQIFHSVNLSFAQEETTPVIDSLIVSLMNDSETDTKVDTYTRLSSEFLAIDYTQSIKYAEKGLILAEKIDYKEGELESRLKLAHIYSSYFLDYAQAKKLYEESVDLALELNDQMSELRAYRGLMIIYRDTKNLELAKHYNQLAIDIATALDDYPLMSDMNSYMGGLFEEELDTVSAVDFYAEVLAIERKNDFRNTSNAAMIGIARYYLLIKDYGQSLKYYRIALKSFERLGDFRWVSYTHSEMAKLYVLKGDLARAEEHALRGLQIAEEGKLRKELGDNYLALVEVYTEMDSVEKAQNYSQAFDSLQDSLKPIEATIDALNEDLKGKEEAVAPKSRVNSFLQAIILIFPVVIFCLFLGMPPRKK